MQSNTVTVSYSVHFWLKPQAPFDDPLKLNCGAAHVCILDFRIVLVAVGNRQRYLAQ